MSTMRTGVAAAVASVVGYVNRPYVPTYLFQNGEQGWWYDPSDFSTLFQDAAGTTPVTAVEQPCGLMLDKRLGLTLGSELVTNGDFSNGTTGWTATQGAIANVSNTLQVTETGAFGRAVSSISTVSGRLYRLTGKIRFVSGSAAFIRTTTSSDGGSGGQNGISSAITSTSFTDVIFYFFATAATTYIAAVANYASGPGSEAYFDDISVRELPGNHAYTPAAASTARPTVSARVNLLTKTEQFDDAAWTKNATTVLTSGVLDPFGGLSAFTVTASGGGATVQQAPTVTSGVSLSASIWIRRRTGTGQISLRCGDTTAIPITVTNNWERVLVSATPTSTGGRMAVLVATDGDAVDIYGADLRVSNDGVGIPAYQRVNTATDYDTVGFPVYLRADGSNDYMLTNSIDFSAGATNAPFGSELVTNGDFSGGATGWTVGTNWSIGSGVATHTAGSQGFLDTLTPGSFTTGTWYKLTFIATRTAGTLYVYVRGALAATISTSQTVSVYVQAGSSVFTGLRFDADSAFAGTIDNISVRELLDSSLAPDKMTICAGVRKLSDAAFASLMEFSSTVANPGAFGLFAPITAAANFSFSSNGTTLVNAIGSGFAAPITSVITGLGNISGDSAILRINGTQAASNTADQGTGNYGNYPLYLFSRAGTSTFLNGRFYGSVGRGAQSNDQQIAALEGYMNSKTKAY